MFTTSAITVENTSSETSCSFKIAFRICFTKRTRPLPRTTDVARSGWVENLFNLLLTTESVNLVLIPSFNGFFQLYACPCEVAALITSNQLCIPTRTDEPSIESVSKEWAISMFTVRVVKQVKRHPYLFTRDLPSFTSSGPKQMCSNQLFHHSILFHLFCHVSIWPP